METLRIIAASFLQKRAIVSFCARFRKGRILWRGPLRIPRALHWFTREVIVCKTPKPVPAPAGAARLFRALLLLAAAVMVVLSWPLPPRRRRNRTPPPAMWSPWARPWASNSSPKECWWWGCLTSPPTRGWPPPARACGLQAGDVITHINGTQVSSIEAVQAMLQELQGQAMTLTITRNDVSQEITAHAAQSSDDGQYKLGPGSGTLWRASAPLTFADPGDRPLRHPGPRHQ